MKIRIILALSQFDSHLREADTGVVNPKRPRDTNQLAKMIVDLTTRAAAEPAPNEGKSTRAVEHGRRGGLKGGKARAATLSPRQRSEIARKAAAARWAGKD